MKDQTNARLVHGDCAPRPQAIYLEIPPGDFVGCWVKVAIKTRWHGTALVEHAWWKVVQVDADTLLGHLDTKLLGVPVDLSPTAQGLYRLRIQRGQIEQVMPSESNEPGNE